MHDDRPRRQSGSSPGARACTAPRPSTRSSSSRSASSSSSNDAGTLPVPVAWQPVLTDSDAIHRLIMAANADPDCIGVIAWMHTFSPAKMWITGLDALRTPLLHLHTQANVVAALGRDRHGLHEPEPGRPRRPRVRLHPDPARRAAQDGGRPRLRSDRRRPGSRAWQRAARGVAAVRSLKLARFGDNMRDVAVTEGDKVEAELQFGVSVNTYGVNDLVERVDAVTEAEVDDLVAEYADAYDVVPELRARRRSARVAALRRPDRGRAARLPRRGRLRRLHHQLRGPGRAPPAARAWPCSG